MTTERGQQSPGHPGPSRRVRLHRTIAGALVLLLLVAVAAYRLSRNGADDLARAERAASSAARSAGVTIAAPTQTPTPSSTATGATPDGEDGSSKPETAPAGAPPVPQQGTGAITVVDVPGPISAAAGRQVTFSVEIEEGLGVDKAFVARTIRDVLLDSRSWQASDHIRLVGLTRAQVLAGRHVDVRVTLASPGLTDKLCAPLRTLSQVSCWNGERSVLNLRRWQLGDDSYGTDIARYRIYQVNHEVGHGLGHSHRSCPAHGAKAPVMVQQTLSLGGCTPWPFPLGSS